MDALRVSQSNDKVSTLFKGSSSAFETACDARSWSGVSKNSFQSQTTEFVGIYNNIITQQLELYQNAVEKYGEYVEAKAELAQLEATRSSMVSQDENADTSYIDQQISALKAKINQLRAEITADLATIMSVNVENATATTNLKDGLSELVEALATFNPQDISTNGRYISNLLDIPYYMQTDPRWANYIMINGHSMYESACGYTSIAMILSGLKRDKNINPKTVADWLKAEVDTNNDGRADSYFDRNGDGVANSSDALSRRADGDGLVQGAVLNREFMNYYGVNVEQVGIGNLQAVMDQGRPCLMTTPGHYVILTPGNNTYYDSNGNIHRTVVLYDPYFPNNTRELTEIPSGINDQRFGCAYAFSNAE